MSSNASSYLICKIHCSDKPVGWNSKVSVTLRVVKSLPVVRLLGRSICSRKVVEDF